MVGNEEAMIDANTACHILVLRMQKLGINATYKMVVPPERMYKTQKPSKGFWSWLLSKREIP